MRLVEGSAELELTHTNGYRVQHFDPGYPAVRSVGEHRTDQDGDVDRTRHHGARLVSLDLLLVPPSGSSLRGLLDDLRRFCHPAQRPLLHFTINGSERRMRLVANAQSAPYEVDLAGGHFERYQRVQVQWVAPDGVAESVDLTVGVAPAAADEEEGFSFDLTFDLTFPTSSPVGAVQVTNAGNVPVDPLLRLYGPFTSGRIENQTTGQRLLFPGLEVTAGNFLEVDVRERTVRLNGNANQDRYSWLDFVESEWWRLLPGVNQIRWFPVTFGAASKAEVRFRSQWL